MRHKSKNKTRPLFTLSLEMTRLVNETRLLLVPSVGIYTVYGDKFHPSKRTNTAQVYFYQEIRHVLLVTKVSNTPLHSCQRSRDALDSPGI